MARIDALSRDRALQLRERTLAAREARFEEIQGRSADTEFAQTVADLEEMKLDTAFGILDTWIQESKEAREAAAGVSDREAARRHSDLARDRWELVVDLLASVDSGRRSDILGELVDLGKADVAADLQLALRDRTADRGHPGGVRRCPAPLQAKLFAPGIDQNVSRAGVQLARRRLTARPSPPASPRRDARISPTHRAETAPVRSEERQADPREGRPGRGTQHRRGCGFAGNHRRARSRRGWARLRIGAPVEAQVESGSNPESSESPIAVDEAPPVETPISFDGATAFSQATEVAVTGVIPVESAAPTEPTRPIDGGLVVEVANAAGSGREVASGIDGASRPTEDVASITTPRTEPSQESARFVEGGVAHRGRAGGPESVARAASIGAPGIQPVGNGVASLEADPAPGPNGSSVQASANADASRAASRPVAAGLEGGRVEVSGMKSVSSATNGRFPPPPTSSGSAEQGDRFDRPPAVSSPAAQRSDPRRTGRRRLPTGRRTRRSGCPRRPARIPRVPRS